MNVHDFIKKLELKSRLDGIPLGKLPFLLHNFVSGPAEKWLLNIFYENNPNPTWRDTRAALIKRYSEFKTNVESKRAVQMRVQQRDESFDSFVVEVQILNSRLQHPFDEPELLEILQFNMKPMLQAKTLDRDFESIDDLREVCEKWERFWLRTSSSFNRAVAPKRSLAVHEITQYEDGEGQELSQAMSSVRVSEIVGDESSDSTIAAIERPSTSRYQNETGDPNIFLTCWNCRDVGHRYTDCDKDFINRFCFGCGEANVIKPNCFNCKNRNAGNWMASASRGVVSRSMIAGVNTPRVKPPDGKNHANS